MKFIKLEDKITCYKSFGFNHGDKVIALLSNGEVKHGTLYFEEDYKTLFEVQLIISDYKSESLFDSLICKIEV